MTKISLTNDYNAMLMIIDLLTKEKHYFLYTINKNGITIEAIVYLLLNNIWKFYNLPISLTLD